MPSVLIKRGVRWPGYRVYQHEIDEAAKTLRLWVRRKRGNRKLICSGCGRKFSEAHDYNEREVRDLPWGEYRTTVINRSVPSVLSELRDQSGEGAAVAEQSAL
jgi:transposase